MEGRFIQASLYACPRARPEILKGGRFLVQNPHAPIIKTHIVNYDKYIFSLLYSIQRQRRHKRSNFWAAQEIKADGWYP